MIRKAPTSIAGRLTQPPSNLPETDEVGRLIEEYLAHCRARGLAPRTVREAYGFPLRRIFLPYCRETGVETLSALDRACLDRWTTGLLDQGGPRGQLSKFTVASYVRAVNGFLKWAQAEGASGAARAQAPRLPKHLVEVLSREQIQQLEDAATSERDKLIVRVLADTGVRVSELISLKIRDITIRDRGHFLRVQGKGDRERYVPLPRLGRRLIHYVERGRPQGTASDRIFLGLRRRPLGDFEPITRSGVNQMVHELAERAGLQQRVHPHLLRHSFATWALTRGVNPVQLAEILGHRSLAMIQTVYAHLSPSDAYDALAQALLKDD